MKAEKKQQQILEVAEEIFARKGFSAATVREIAEGVNIKTPALYYHFRSKEEIFNSLVTERYAELRLKVLKPIRQEPDARRKLQLMIELLIDFWAVHPRLPRLLAQQVLWGPPANVTDSKILANVLVPMFDELIESLSAGELEKAGLRDVDVTTLVFNVFGMTTFYFFVGQVLTVLTGRESFSPDSITMLKREIEEMVFEGIEQRDD
ncbi:MAG: TetR/AcrR family transcriptional regulator [Actinobacteria bacterium]|nr:TetR/AcrR family transcriptional regulator [Actinomycetota bacterium]MBU2688774.1 TetR/AcrR family transcriptional regulator [Actinomycetota bacterium]